MKKLILLPYAGSLGLAYTKWVRPLSGEFDLYRIDYNRLHPEKNYYEPSSWVELVELVMRKIESIVTDDNYIIYGHSMGVRMAAVVYYEMKKKGLPLPEKVILSGCELLSEITKDPDEQGKKEFRNEYIEMGGISDEVLENDELSELAFEALEKDIRLLSQFDYEDYKTRFECPVSILNGNKDHISSQKEWEELLGIPVEYHIYEGKHFFIYDHEKEIIEYLSGHAGK